MIPFWHATASGMPAMFEPRHSPDVGTWRAGAIPCAPGSLAAPPTTLARESGPRVDKLVPYLFYLSVCEVDVIRTTTRRRHGRGHLHPLCRRSGIPASAVLALAALQRLRPPRSRRPCALRDPVGRRRVVGRIAPASAVHGLRKAWGESSAFELG
jgi:hypothetical protein